MFQHPKNILCKLRWLLSDSLSFQTSSLEATFPGCPVISWTELHPNLTEVFYGDCELLLESTKYMVSASVSWCQTEVQYSKNIVNQVWSFMIIIIIPSNKTGGAAFVFSFTFRDISWLFIQNSFKVMELGKTDGMNIYWDSTSSRASHVLSHLILPDNLIYTRQDSFYKGWNRFRKAQIGNTSRAGVLVHLFNSKDWAFLNTELYPFEIIPPIL